MESKERVVKSHMGRLIIALLTLSILALFSFGCSPITKETKIKCPKCGAIFNAGEGIAEIQKKP